MVCDIMFSYHYDHSGYFFALKGHGQGHFPNLKTLAITWSSLGIKNRCNKSNFMKSDI